MRRWRVISDVPTFCVKISDLGFVFWLFKADKFLQL